MFRLAVFNTHPIQHFAPWWKELARELRVKVFFFSQANKLPHFDAGFGKTLCFDVDLLSGYDHAFLPHRWPFHKRIAHSWYMLNRGVRQAVREEPWDAVLVFGYNQLNNWVVLRECKRANIPVLYYGDSNFQNLRNVPGWKSTAKRLWIKSFFKGVNTFLCPGNSNMDYLRHYGVPQEKMRLCPLPVDVERFQAAAEACRGEREQLRKRFELAADYFVITFNGKLVPRKRPLDLIEAVRRLGDPRVKALFVGTGPLEQEVRRHGGDCVRITGFVNQSEIPGILSLGDVAVMPSEYDPHPLAVTESLALGIPVVVSDRLGCYGPDDALRPEENGFVYPCGNVAELASILSRLRDDSALRARLGERALALVQTQTPQAARDAVLGFLEENSARRGRASAAETVAVGGGERQLK